MADSEFNLFNFLYCLSLLSLVSKVNSIFVLEKPFSNSQLQKNYTKNIIFLMFSYLNPSITNSPFLFIV